MRRSLLLPWKSARKVLWTVCFCVNLTCAYFVFIKDSLSQWNHKPVETTIETTDYPVQNFHFPSVTMCPHHDTEAVARTSPNVLIIEFLNLLQYSCPSPGDCQTSAALRKTMSFWMEPLEEAIKKSFNASASHFGSTRLYEDWEIELFHLRRNINHTSGYNMFKDTLLEKINAYTFSYPDPYDVKEDLHKRYLELSNSTDFVNSSYSFHLGFAYNMRRALTLAKNAFILLEKPPLPLGDLFILLVPLLYPQEYKIEETVSSENNTAEVADLHAYFSLLSSKFIQDDEVKWPPLSKLPLVLKGIDNSSDNDSNFVVENCKVAQEECLDNPEASEETRRYPCSKSRSVNFCWPYQSQFIKTKLQQLLTIAKYSLNINIASLKKSIYEDFIAPGYVQDLGYGAQHLDSIPSRRISFIRECFFGPGDAGNEMSFCKDSFPVLTSKGICAAFNSIPVHKTFKDSSYIRAFNKAFGSMEPQVKKVTGSGESHGLLLLVDSSSYAFQSPMNFSNEYSTFVITLTTPWNPFDILTDSTTLIGGFYTAIQVVMDELYSSDSIRSLPIKDRHCRFSDETEGLDLMKNYSKSGCEFECLLKRAKAACGCIPYDYPLSEKDIVENLPLCVRRGVRCFKSVMTNVSMVSNCSCESNCNGVSYTLIYSASLIKQDIICNRGFLRDSLWKEAYEGNYQRLSQFSKLVLNPGANIRRDPFDSLTADKYCLERVSHDMAIANIKVSKPRVTRSNQALTMTMAQKIAFVGGTIGLFTGVSLLSLLDLIEWIVKSLKTKK